MMLMFISSNIGYESFGIAVSIHRRNLIHYEHSVNVLRENEWINIE